MRNCLRRHVYNKRGTAEQWIKEGKQAVKMTPLSCHRFRSNEVRLVAERDRLQPGKPLAAAGAAEEDRGLVLDQLAAAVGEDGWTAGQTCALDAVGRGASHATAFWQQAEKDRAAAAAGRVANQERQRIECSEVIPSGQVSAAWHVGGGKQTRQVTGTVKASRDTTQKRRWRG